MTNYFTPEETQCKCGCGWDITPAFRDTLNTIRVAYGHPIATTNAARCKKHNSAVGGAKRSAHIDGVAADFVRSKALREFLEKNLEVFGLWMEHPSKTGTDSGGWLHIDSRLRIGGRVFFP